MEIKIEDPGTLNIPNKDVSVFEISNSEFAKLKQVMRAIRALPCECELLKQNCAACLAKEFLNEKEVTEDERAMFSVNLDGINGDPAMIVSISRKDGLLPLVTDTENRAAVAAQELLLRLSGVLVEALQNIDEFKLACAKWGLDFSVQQGS